MGQTMGAQKGSADFRHTVTTSRREATVDYKPPGMMLPRQHSWCTCSQQCVRVQFQPRQTAAGVQNLSCVKQTLNFDQRTRQQREFYPHSTAKVPQQENPVWNFALAKTRIGHA